MNKKIRKAVSVLEAALMITIFSAATAMAYTTDCYDINVTVGEDNSYQITEDIQVTFHEQQHGIFRYIPIEDQDGRRTLKIKDVDAPDVAVHTYDENGCKVIRLGDDDTYVTGRQEYRLEYTMQIYDDGDTERDLLYLDLLPAGWESDIGESFITVALPKPVDEEAIQIYAGAYGREDVHENVSWSYDDEKRIISILGTELPEGTGITVYIPLEEGYWVGQKNTGWIFPFAVILMLGAPLAVFLYWLMRGREPKVVKTVEFYPPQGMDPSEVGYFYDGTVDNRDFSAMIVYFAEKGYLRLEEKKGQIFVYSTGSPEGRESPAAVSLYRGIFENAGAGNEVCLSEAGAISASIWYEFGSRIKAKYSGDMAPMDQKGKSRQRKALIILGGGHLASMVLFSLYSRTYSALGMEVVSLSILIFTLMKGIRYKGEAHIKSKAKNRLRAFFIGLLTFITASLSLVQVSWAGGGEGLGFLFMVLLFVAVPCTINMERRNKANVRIMGQIEGLRDFIEKAELPKLNMLVEENPAYFYNVLPYAYVMGLTKKWIEKFENIVLEPVEWYHSDRTELLADSLSLMEAMARMEHIEAVQSAPKAVVNRERDGGDLTGDTGFSTRADGESGGFSGGGHGGGGGGAW